MIRPELRIQDLHAMGINPFAVELLVESFYKMIEGNHTASVGFRFRGVWVHLEVDRKNEDVESTR